MDRRIAVSEFLTATCAPAIARPELSLTLPEIVPPATCARQALPVDSTTALTDANVKELETKAARMSFRSISTLLFERIRLNNSKKPKLPRNCYPNRTVNFREIP